MTVSKFDTVIFDMGGVLIPSPVGLFEAVEAKLELKHGSIVETLFGPEVKKEFNILECGITCTDEFEPIFTAIYNKKHGTSVKTIPFSGPSGRGVTLNINIYPQMLCAVKELKARGIKVVLLTNNFWRDKDHEHHTIPQAVRDLFDVIVESCREGLRKPESPIYKLTLERAQTTAEKSIFLDDLVPNCDGATAVGIKSILVSDIDAAIVELQNLLGFKFESLQQ